MPQILWRLLIAVFACLLFFALLPPVSRIIGFSVTGDLYTVVRICVAAIAVCYIVWGRPVSWGPPRL
jgi:hypothetical protein